MVKRLKTQYYWLAAEGPRLANQLVDTFIDYDKFKYLSNGSSHTTIVIPGFSTTNNSTAFLRKVLELNHHKAIEWVIHRNMGFDQKTMEESSKQILETADKSGKKVNIVGQSLGGCYARALANKHPDHVNMIITLGSPINGIGLINKHTIENYNEAVGLVDAAVIQHTEYFETFYPNPPCPVTSIFSKNDGVVHWSQSLITERKHSENIEIDSSHFGMGFNYDTLKIITDRLVQPPHNWKKWSES